MIVIGLVLASVWHIEFLRIPTGSDDDVRRYVWDGRLQRLGYNPYVVVPDDPAFAAMHTAETRALNNPDLPSIYPPGAQLFFRAVTAIHESAFAMRVAFAICELAIVLVLLDVLRGTGQAAHWILAFAWNPLLATEAVGSGHIDILGVLLLIVSFAALIRRWRAVAALTFALAVSVKFLPIVLLPLYWRRVRIRDALMGAIVFVLLYLPFLDHGRIPSRISRQLHPRLWFQRSGFCSASTSSASADSGGTRSFRGPSYRSPIQSQAPELLCGRICLADGRFALLRTGRVPVVLTLASAVRAIGFNIAAHCMDGQHYPHVYRLAFAHTGTSLCASGAGSCCWNTEPSR